MSDIKMRYGFVCVLDILGTKELWKEKNIKNYLSKRESLIQEHKIIISKYNKSLHLDLSIQTISDTMIISTHVNKDVFLENHFKKYNNGTYRTKSIIKRHILNSICIQGFSQDNIPILKIFLTWHYFNKLISKILSDYFISDLYVRGSITYDKFYKFKDSMIIGPAINKASREFEKANWIGIHLDEHSSQLLSKKGFFGTSYHVPFKGYSMDLNFIDWINPNIDKHVYLDKLNIIIDKLKSRSMKNDEVLACVIQKYINTIEFIEEMYKRHREIEDMLNESNEFENAK